MMSACATDELEYDQTPSAEMPFAVFYSKVCF